MRVPLAVGMIAGLTVPIFVLTVSAVAGVTSSDAQESFTIERVSIASDGRAGSSVSTFSSISADGRFVAFHSLASNLVPGDTNRAFDVLVHDRKTRKTTRVSLNSDDAQGNQSSSFPSISADGRFVAFQSWASNLVSSDTNRNLDVFVHDRKSGQTTRVSVDSDGSQGNHVSSAPSISADGRFVAFKSLASNLVPVDINGKPDVFVHDLQTGETTRVSLDSGGSEGNFGAHDPSISADGRFVSFSSDASNLVPTDTNMRSDVFVHDRQTGETARVSVASSGVQGDGNSGAPSISSDGRLVAFDSDASNLVLGDSNGERDVFVHDRQTGETERVSVDSDGGQTSNDSWPSSISADGSFVAFDSMASDLVAEDTNGMTDVFVHDRQTGVTTRVSIASDGTEGNSISPDTLHQRQRSLRRLPYLGNQFSAQG